MWLCPQRAGSFAFSPADQSVGSRRQAALLQSACWRWTEGNSKIKQNQRLLRAQINEENRGWVQCNCKQEMIWSTNAMALFVCFILLVLKYVWRDEVRYLLKKLSVPDRVKGLQWAKTTWISNFYSLLTPWHHILCKPWPTFIYWTLSLCLHCIVIKIFIYVKNFILLYI